MSIKASKTARQAILVLADGTVFHGSALGADSETVGEIVFNTAMTGYQEILTDPSYANQIVTLTYPHIGNYGTNSEDTESTRIWARGLVVRDVAMLASNFRSQQSLHEYLAAAGVTAIADIDTRRLTNHLRQHGAQSAAIVTYAPGQDVPTAAALAVAGEFGGLQGLDLARVASCEEIYEWTAGAWELGHGFAAPHKTDFHVVAYDFGCKHNILRLLVARGCRVTVVPAQTTAAEVLKLNPDGVFLSNGPGDPAPCDYAIQAIQTFLTEGLPLFGICLGHQLLALACGARTEKMKFGHHGANHPVQDLAHGRVLITSQNHGFAVAADSLPESLAITHKSLFDDTLQGIRHQSKPAIGFQGHPEASPGPHDAEILFDEFIRLMAEQGQGE